ncbi:hypothetical protein LXL04_017704 [Taraxacum kok-saghyz]
MWLRYLQTGLSGGPSTRFSPETRPPWWWGNLGKDGLMIPDLVCRGGRADHGQYRIWQVMLGVRCPSRSSRPSRHPSEAATGGVDIFQKPRTRWTCDPAPALFLLRLCFESGSRTRSALTIPSSLDLSHPALPPAKPFTSTRRLPVRNSATQWNMFVPTKDNVLIWCVLLNCFLVRCTLVQRGLDIDMCLFRFWDGDLDRHSLNCQDMEMASLDFMTVIWVIWTYLNAIVFQYIEKQRYFLFDNIVVFSFSWFLFTKLEGY